MRRFTFTLIAFLFFAPGLGGCARNTFPEGVMGALAVADIPAMSGIWVFRHALVLEIPERNISLSFTGMMRLDYDTKTVDVVGLGGMGLTLFDLQVTEGAFAARFLHPSVVRLPKAAERIAAIIRFVWLESLPFAVVPPAKAQESTFAALRDERGAFSAVHIFDEGALRKTIMARGGLIDTIMYFGNSVCPWPETLTLTGQGYTLTVRLLEARQLKGSTIP